MRMVARTRNYFAGASPKGVECRLHVVTDASVEQPGNVGLKMSIAGGASFTMEFDPGTARILSHSLIENLTRATMMEEVL